MVLNVMNNKFDRRSKGMSGFGDVYSFEYGPMFDPFNYSQNDLFLNCKKNKFNAIN